MPELAAPVAGDIVDAAERIASTAVRTPFVIPPVLAETTGRPVALKLETQQRTGTFKFRGAMNFLSRIDPVRRATGVVGYSSGNHAQGVAAAARILGVPATIVMPSDAPPIKLQRTRALGAEVVFYDRLSDSREEIGAALAAERGVTLVPPYDHPWTIAGQGTAGLEIAQQAAAAGFGFDRVLVPCGGGGLSAGIALALESAAPGAGVVTVEPSGFDDHVQSFAAGTRIGIDPAAATTICDALLPPIPGEYTFPITKRLVAGGLAVDDDEVVAAMRFAFSELKLVIEPGGAAGLAALLAGKADGDGGVVVVASGGNVDPGFFAEVVAGR